MYYQNPYLERSAINNLLDISDEMIQWEHGNLAQQRNIQIKKKKNQLMKTYHHSLINTSIRSKDSDNQIQIQRPRPNSIDNIVQSQQLPISTHSITPEIKQQSSQQLQYQFVLTRSNHSSMNDMTELSKNMFQRKKLSNPQMLLKRRFSASKQKILSPDPLINLAPLSSLQLKQLIDKKIQTLRKFKQIYISPLNQRQTFLPQSYPNRGEQFKKSQQNSNIVGLQYPLTGNQNYQIKDHLGQVTKFLQLIKLK